MLHSLFPSGPSGFPHAAGLTIAVITMDSGEAKYSYLQTISEGKMFNADGFFLLERDSKLAEDVSAQIMDMHVSIPT